SLPTTYAPILPIIPGRNAKATQNPFVPLNEILTGELEFFAPWEPIFALSRSMAADAPTEPIGCRLAERQRIRSSGPCRFCRLH
ncbi:MAG: hypothetical protein ACK43N_00355, partial [Pirellulaceae bacterium]